MPKPKVPSQPAVGIARLPDIQFQQADIDTVVTEAKDSVAKKMGIPSANLPPQITDAIKMAANSTMNADEGRHSA